MFGSAVTSVSPSSRAWATSIRSNGSAWWRGSSPASRAWSNVMASGSKPNSVISWCQRTGGSSLPTARLMAISQALAALTRT